jgi:4'-phosphopantetheinyl transferase
MSISGGSASLETCDIHVHYRRVGDIGDEYARNLEMLGRHEVEAAQRFLRDRDRAAYVAAHALLRQVLSTHDSTPPSAWIFDTHADGKPVLSGRHSTNLSFNLSHTRGLVACVVCRTRDVGIDVELIDPRVEALEIASRFFSEREVAGLRASVESERPARFAELWTLKEAYAKATGAGLSTPLHTYGFTYEGATALRFMPAVGEHADWQFALFAPTSDHRMSVAARRRAGETLRITTCCEFRRVEAQTLRVSSE